MQICRVWLGVVGACSVTIFLLAGASGFTHKRGGPSANSMREQYTTQQGELLRQSSKLLAEMGRLQKALIDDMRAFIDGDGAPCCSASKEQLASATHKTRDMTEQMARMRKDMRLYAEKTRLFLPDERPRASATQA